MSGPAVPPRVSSKRALEDDRDDVNKQLKDERKKLKPQPSFNAE